MGVKIYRPGDRVLSIGGPQIITPRGGAASNGLLNNLVAFWPGDELNGYLLDAHTNGLHLTDVNTVTSNPGHVYPTARQYTAANSEYHTRAGDDALLSAGDTDFTIAAWVYPDSLASSMNIAAKDSNTVGEREYRMLYSSGSSSIVFVVYDGSGLIAAVYSGIITVLATWYLVVGWHDSVNDTISVQVNGGVPVSAATGGTAPGDGAAKFTVASWDAFGYKWNGRIGPTAFWKSAPGGGGVLTAEQRTALWDAGAGLKYEDLTA